VRWPDEQWRASVTYKVQHEWGPGRHQRSVPDDQVRLPQHRPDFVGEDNYRPRHDTP
jgi:hypothetical protein